jgi:Head domain of trimeric autotransporter adhesin/Chaperone of endosialidase
MKKLFLLLLLAASQVALAQNVGINNTNPQAALDLQGDLRLRSAVLTLPAGINNDVDLTTVKSSVYMFGGGALTINACQITGFTGGVDGRIITIFNNSILGSIQLYDAGFSISPSAAANKILTGTGNNAIILSNGSATLRYDGAKQKWVIVSSNFTNGLTNEFWKLSGLSGDEIKSTNAGGIWSESFTSLDDVTTTNITNPPTAPTSGAGTRMMWIPNRSAFRVGTVQNTPTSSTASTNWDANNIGLFSFASGYSPVASGKHAIAMGYVAKSTGLSTLALGYQAQAVGDYSSAIGRFALSNGVNSTAIGSGSVANGIGSFSLGTNSTSGGDYGTALGFNTNAYGSNSTSFGNSTNASGSNSTAIGTSTNASGVLSMAMGNLTNAGGFTSTAMGYNTTASGNYSTAMGSGTYATNEYSTSMGNGTQASGYNSTAMGFTTNASGQYTTAMGNSTQAVGNYSTAMGFGSYAPGLLSTAMGKTTQAIGDYSTSMGYETYANGLASTAIGIFNQPNANALFMVGNGINNSNRYTTFTIRKDNNCVGINNDNPQAALHVSGFQNVSGGQASFFYPASEYNNLNTYYYNSSRHIYSLTDAPTFIASLGILSDYGIMSKTYVGSGVNIVSSDSRIKNIIGISNSKEDLDRLKKIQITNYKMKDVNTWGNQVFKKVIAQQIEEVYPEVIKKTKSTIPDIYALAQTVAYNQKNKELTITLSKSYDIKIGDKIELVHPTNGKQVAEVIAVMDNSFTVKDWAHATDKIFVFGREVNDFRNVDYEALSMLGISAIQQLAKEVEDLKKENKKLVVDFESRLNNLELKLNPIIVVNK